MQEVLQETWARSGVTAAETADRIFEQVKPMLTILQQRHGDQDALRPVLH
jgi:hypothetical protein